MTRPVLLYDGDCAFCTSCVRLVEKRLRPEAEVLAWQFADLAELGVSAEQAADAVQWIQPGGSVRSGHEAIAAMLSRSGPPWRLAGRILVLPGASWLAARAYRLVAANRHRLPGGTPACRMRREMDAATAEKLREGQRAVWAAGDWPAFAAIVQEVADSTVEMLGAEAGHDHLDVATGSGNAAIAAARRGARTTGLDLVPELVDAARARAAGEGLEIEFVVGNAEELPFADGSFDRVSSIFGVIFAPRHRQAAGELVRVTRPGGSIAVTAWTPEGMNGQMFKTIGEYMPPPPEGFEPPVLWGTEEHVRELFSAPGLEVSCEKRMAEVAWDSLEQWMDHCERNLGPIVMAKAALEPQGKWEAARADLIALEERYNEADDGSMRAHAEYLLTTVARPS